MGRNVLKIPFLKPPVLSPGGFFFYKEIIMPMVGGKKYSYTKAGMAAAKKAAKSTGKKMTTKKSYGKKK